LRGASQVFLFSTLFLQTLAPFPRAFEFFFQTVAPFFHAFSLRTPVVLYYTFLHLLGCLWDSAILRTFILYYLWFERCRKHFDDSYSLNKVLQQAWVATVEVSMATSKAIRAPRPDKDLESKIGLS
jgi:hypothetical protein